MRFLVIFIICLFANSAFASENIAALYRIYWMNLHVGDLVAEISANENEVRFTNIMRARNIAKKAGNFRSKTITNAAFDGEKFIPSSFYTSNSLRKRTRNIEIKYDESGNIISEKINLKEDPSKRLSVENILKSDAYDPLTIALNMRKIIFQYKNHPSYKFMMKLYEGRRLSELNFTIIGTEKIDINGNLTELVHISLYRHPIAGFSKDELANMDNEEPDVDIYLSNDDDMIPVKVVAKAKIGSAIAYLEKKCNKLADCDIR